MLNAAAAPAAATTTAARGAACSAAVHHQWIAALCHCGSRSGCGRLRLWLPLTLMRSCRATNDDEAGNIILMNIAFTAFKLNLLWRVQRLKVGNVFLPSTSPAHTIVIDKFIATKMH